jgi:hypothetical protein
VAQVNRPATLGSIGVVLAVCLTLACGLSPFDPPQSKIEVQPDGVYSGLTMSSAAARGLIAKQSTQVSPVLFPSYITDGMTNCNANGAKDRFNVQCGGGAISFDLATQTENPADYKPKVMKALKFRADLQATFVDVDPANVNAVRFLVWVEPGQSADKACKCVHYDLHTVGISADELWKIANSLQIAKPS